MYKSFIKQIKKNIEEDGLLLTIIWFIIYTALCFAVGVYTAIALAERWL